MILRKHDGTARNKKIDEKLTNHVFISLFFLENSTEIRKKNLHIYLYYNNKKCPVLKVKINEYASEIFLKNIVKSHKFHSGS